MAKSLPNQQPGDQNTKFMIHCSVPQFLSYFSSHNQFEAILRKMVSSWKTGGVEGVRQIRVEFRTASSFVPIIFRN